MKLLARFDTGLCADTAEVAPGGTLAAVGTYQLAETSGQRHGRLHLLHCTPARPLEAAAVVELPGDGLLDCKWRPGADRGLVLGSVHASGRLQVRRVVGEGGPLGRVRVELMVDAVVGSNNGSNDGDSGGGVPLALAMDWDRLGERVAVSYSDGRAVVWQVRPDGTAAAVAQWCGHGDPMWGSEVWTTAFGRQADSEHTVVTGGDDARLRCWDVRAGSPAEQPAWMIRCEAGVTAAQFSPTVDGRLLAVGSYDEQLRLIDWRTAGAGGRVRPVAELRGPGGVWRVKWRGTDRLVSCCMRGGYAEARVDAAAGDVAWVRKWQHDTADDSLAYGVDWADDEGGTRVLTCSFYDHLACLWQLEDGDTCD